MKSIKVFFVVFVLTIFLASFVDAAPRRHHHRVRTKPTVGAPLDGGLLILLGAAGTAAYYGVRKRKEKQ